MTTATDGTGNTHVAGDVRDINQTFTKLQFYGTSSGYREVIVRDEIDPEHVAWLDKRFAEPGRYANALARLSDRERMVFLAGPLGSGRWTAAVRLLAKVSGVERPVIKVIEPDEETRLDLRRIPHGAQVLLDLTGTDDQTLRAIEPKIKNFMGTVAGAEGRLVVLMSGRESDDLQTTYYGRTVRIDPPLATEVARKHLVADGVPEEDVARVDLSTVLGPARPADAARFASLVREELPEAASLDEAIQRATDAYDDWSRTLVKDYDEQEEDIERRSLLLTVALLTNGDIEALYQTEQRLLQLAGYRPQKDNLLAGKGFARRLTDLPGATYRSGRAWFTRRAYDQSVLRHAWNGYPELRPRLVDWVAEVGDKEKVPLSEAEANDMADRFAAFCASEGAGSAIADVAKRWAESGNASRTRLAVRLLTTGALDGQVGPAIHRYLNNWARKPDLSGQLANVVREVCVSRFGRVHTDKALTRLGNLAGHKDTKVSDDVVTAVLELVRDNDVLPQTLGKLAEWLAGDKNRRKVVAVQIFTKLTEPAAGVLDLETLRQQDMRALLVRVWGEVLSIDDIDVTDPAVAAWLAGAAGQPQWWEPVLDMFAEAAGADNARRGTLMTGASYWLGVLERNGEPTDPGPKAAVEGLRARLYFSRAMAAQPVENGNG